MDHATRTFELPLDPRELALAVIVIVLGAIGSYLLLPHRHGSAKPWRVHMTGGGMMTFSVLILAMFWTPPGPWLTNLFFYVFGFASIGGAVLMIASRNPIYSALWFAVVVLATSGLFLLAGAQFLAAGTIIVYAGAIIVTFLFVIMLAQSQGQALYDRTARTPGRATFSCFLLLWCLLYALLVVRAVPVDAASAQKGGRRVVAAKRLTGFLNLPPGSAPAQVLDRSIRPTARWAEAADPPAPANAPHVAGLGGTLYTDHLISAEVAGVLLFVALVGALAIALPKSPAGPGEPAAVRPADAWPTAEVR